MLTFDEILGVVYLQITVIGFLGNCILLFLNSIHLFNAQRKRIKNLIIITLAFSNAMMLLFRGISTTTRLWKVKCLLDVIGIRIITSMQILTRSVSLCSTSFLSAYQAITICPNNSIWAKFKRRSPKDFFLCILLCWFSFLLLDVTLVMYSVGDNNKTISKYGCNYGYFSLDVNHNNQLKFIIIIDVYDALFVFLMIFSSGYMVSILLRHKKHVNHIHSKSLSTKISPEIKATQVIVLLVSIFVLFNAFYPIFDFCVFYFKYGHTWMIHSSVILSLCYPSLSPFILISIDMQISRFCVH
ncbi:vomeronasal type-1 receptor 1-like [Macrotis lagotis]|uniref:vomeronasal type-1 receptor 1-like n=1 Tax=Macrotis lagotis TaxID=92651 RepID=UPI003D681720